MKYFIEPDVALKHRNLVFPWTLQAVWNGMFTIIFVVVKVLYNSVLSGKELDIVPNLMVAVVDIHVIAAVIALLFVLHQ